jgi:hypothetical protein
MSRTLQAFSSTQQNTAKRLLATCVANMMGRKFEEGDWASVYCQAKGIPEAGWSNLHIDVMHQGLGVEHKMLCVGGDKPLMSTAGTALMHPSATRSIRVASTDIPAQDAMVDIFCQYKELIEARAARVSENAGGKAPDMRTGWLLWERSLTEFIYFEERMAPPNPDLYWAEWNERPAKGSRKSSKNLWIYERDSNKKKFSITTSAGAKIQPYFDVPSPADPNLVYLRVQGEPIGHDKVQIWITADSAQKLRLILQDDTLDSLSHKIISAAHTQDAAPEPADVESHLAIPVVITKTAHEALNSHWDGVSDAHRIQLLIQAIHR